MVLYLPFGGAVASCDGSGVVGWGVVLSPPPVLLSPTKQYRTAIRELIVPLHETASHYLEQNL